MSLSLCARIESIKRPPPALSALLANSLLMNSILAFPVRNLSVQLIRYYLHFRVAIPINEASYPCITHPCATKVLLLPFDLHVLGTPPAFVLSQNQTLQFNAGAISKKQ